METITFLSDQIISGKFLESRAFYTILAIVVFWLVNRSALLVLLPNRGSRPNTASARPSPTSYTHSPSW